MPAGPQPSWIEVSAGFSSSRALRSRRNHLSHNFGGTNVGLEPEALGSASLEDPGSAPNEQHVAQIEEGRQGGGRRVNDRVAVEKVVTAPAARDEVRLVHDPGAVKADADGLLRNDVVDGQLEPPVEDRHVEGAVSASVGAPFEHLAAVAASRDVTRWRLQQLPTTARVCAERKLVAVHGRRSTGPSGATGRTPDAIRRTQPSHRSEQGGTVPR